jgi:hypothetical protein
MGWNISTAANHKSPVDVAMICHEIGTTNCWTWLIGKFMRWDSVKSNRVVLMLFFVTPHIQMERQSHYRFHAHPPDILLSIHTKKIFQTSYSCWQHLNSVTCNFLQWADFENFIWFSFVVSKVGLRLRMSWAIPVMSFIAWTDIVSLLPVAFRWAPQLVLFLSNAVISMGYPFCV